MRSGAPNGLSMSRSPITSKRSGAWFTLEFEDGSTSRAQLLRDSTPVATLETRRTVAFVDITLTIRQQSRSHALWLSHPDAGCCRRATRDRLVDVTGDQRTTLPRAATRLGHFHAAPCAPREARLGCRAAIAIWRGSAPGRRAKVPPWWVAFRCIRRIWIRPSTRVRIVR